MTNDFDNPILTKTEEKDNANTFMYAIIMLNITFSNNDDERKISFNSF